MDFFKAAIKAIPDAASTPQGLIAFVCVVSCFAVIAWRVIRNNQLLKHIEKFPEKDRARVFEAEIGSIRLPKGLTPEQWLRNRLSLYYLTALVLLCVTVLLIVVVVVKSGGEGAEPPHVVIDRPPGGHRIDEKGRVSRTTESEGLSGEPDQPGGGPGDWPEDRKLSFTYAREKDVPHIGYALPYLDRFRDGGSIAGILYERSPFRWQFPNLSVKVVNNSSKDLLLSEARIEVLSSTVVDEPILVVDDLSINKIELVNEGWGAMVDPVVTFGIDAVADGGGDAARRAETHTVSLATFTGEASIPIARYIPARLRRDDMVRVEGQIVHGPAAGRKTVRFTTRVLLQIPPPRLAPPPTYLYDVSLVAGEAPRIVLLPVTQEIKPRTSDNFLIRVASDKSARFKLRISFRTVGGGDLLANDVLLDVFVPRSGSSFTAKKVKKEDGDAKS